MTPDLLRACISCSEQNAIKFSGAIDAAMTEHLINTPARQSAYLAQIGHESGRLMWVRELWGPTKQQGRYERDLRAAWPPTPRDVRNDVAYSLGNSEPGDGVRFKGRGLIQITGRTNYRQASQALGVDLITNPQLLEQPDLAAMSSAWWWRWHGLNELADKGAFIDITRRINGGTNGLDDRFHLYRQAQAVLNRQTKEQNHEQGSNNQS